MTNEPDVIHDVVVIGGGPAGLSAALILGRARRSVLVIDAGEPRNAPASGVHGFLSRDGIAPVELESIARAEVRRYGVQILDGVATSVARTGAGFAVTTAEGRMATGRRLLVTTGLVDELPALPGLRERWGRDVLHCPYCHGWEVRDEPIGILATGPKAGHQAQLFRQLSADVTLLMHTAAPLSASEEEELEARGIRIVTGEVESLDVIDDRLAGVRLVDGTDIPLRALAVGPRFFARSDVLTSLGLEPTPHPMGIGEYIAADPMGLTAVPGVWVAGNVTDLMAQVLGSAEGGAVAARAINADLVGEDGRVALAAHRRAHWDDFYRSTDSHWSGRPNDGLVRETQDLTVGTALDVGCGEGADAIWLAERGWQVSAVDVSAVALERSAARASLAGDGVAARIGWVPADFSTWNPGVARFDLVSAQYMHVPSVTRRALFDRLAAAVAPNGTLLIVGHHPSDLHAAVPRPPDPDLFFTGDDVVAHLDPDDWIVVTNEAVPRTVDHHDGVAVSIRDAVVRARRRRR